MLNKTAILIAASLMLFPASATAASTQDDVQTCREAMQVQGYDNMDSVRLRYVSSKGNNRARSITVKVISYDGAPSYDVTCQLSKTKVVAVNKNGATLHAKK